MRMGIALCVCRMRVGLNLLNIRHEGGLLLASMPDDRPPTLYGGHVVPRCAKLQLIAQFLSLTKVSNRAPNKLHRFRSFLDSSIIASPSCHGRSRRSVAKP